MLLRVVGPLAGYLAAIQFVDQNWKKSIHPCNNSDLIAAIRSARKNVPENLLDSLKTTQKGSILIMSAPLCEYAQNLAYKFLEGLFARTPTIIDYLSFSHGTFQQLITDPMPIIIFRKYC